MMKNTFEYGHLDGYAGKACAFPADKEYMEGYIVGESDRDKDSKADLVPFTECL